MSLRARLGIVIAVVLAASLGTLSVSLVRSTRTDLMRATERSLQRSLSNRIRATPPPPGSRRRDPRSFATAHLAIASDGRVLAAEPAGPPIDPTPLPDLSRTDLAKLRTGSTVLVDAVDGSLRYLVMGRIGSANTLEIEAAPLSDTERTLAALERRLVVGGLITLALGVLTALIAVWQGLRPLDDVVATADAVAAGERERRILTDTGPHEVRRLSTALDRMLQQQRTTLADREASEARLRRFVADASHELQTPITSVLGWIELQRKGALTDTEQATAMTRVEAESRRMARLVSDLVVLARLDEYRTNEFTAVDVSAIAHDAVTDARAVEPDRPINIDAPLPQLVDGDATSLRQVFDNLIRNVRTHTPAATPVHISVTGRDHEVVFSVRDEGPGIDPEDLEHIFDRFWRAEMSRARSAQGAGLGLAIVAALVATHGGTVDAATGTPGGAILTVRLPRLDGTSSHED